MISQVIAWLFCLEGVLEYETVPGRNKKKVVIVIDHYHFTACDRFLDRFTRE